MGYPPQGATSGQAQAQYPANVTAAVLAPSPGAFSKMAAASNYVRDIAERAEALTNKLVGPRPALALEKAPHNDNGIIGLLEGTADEVNWSCNRIADALSAIESQIR